MRGCIDKAGIRFVGEGWFALLIRVVEGGAGVVGAGAWGVDGAFAGLVGRGDVPAEEALLLVELVRRRPDALGVRWWLKAGRTPGAGRRYNNKVVSTVREEVDENERLVQDHRWLL